MNMKMGPEVPNCYYRVSVKALITNEAGKILVVNERGLGWDLPGGGLDWGEHPIIGLQREIREELGCNATIDTQPIMIAPSDDNAHRQHVLWIVYRAKLLAQTERIDTACKSCYMSLEEFRKNEEKYDAIDWESPIDFWSDLNTFIKK